MRKANLRHGFYSQSQEAATRALGENPEEFHRLREGLRGKTTAAATLEEQIADRLARAFLLLNRADRMQEGYAEQKAREEDCKREGRLHMQMMHLKMTAREWYFLSLSVARQCYVTVPYDLDLMKQLHKEGMVKDMSEVALGLFYQLREPGTLGPGDPGFDDDESIAQQRRVLFKIKQIFGLENNPDPDEKPRIRPALPLPPAKKVAGAAQAGAAPGSRPANAGVSATQPELDAASQQVDTTADGKSRIPNPEFRIPYPVSRIPDREPRVPNPEPRVPRPKLRISRRVSQHYGGAMGGARAGPSTSGESFDAAGGDFRGPAPRTDAAVRERAHASRTSRANRAHPPRCAVHAENGRFELSADYATVAPARAAEARRAPGGSAAGRPGIRKS